MNYVSGVLTKVTRFAASINPATLSGAIDVVLVEQPDGSFKSTPFYVKFGKIGVFSAKEKTVDITINGIEIPFHMVLDDFGIAHFPRPEQPADATNSNMLRELSHPSLLIETAPQHSELTSSPLKRVRRNSEPSPSESEHSGWEEAAAAQDGGALCAASRALSNPDLSTIEAPPLDDSESCSASGGQAVEVLQLNKDQLAEYNLWAGVNDATFSITTQFQGTARCTCNIFVWSQKERIVISDIDGTITRSDVRGMILPMIGITSWTQGEVTKLFTKIAENGYKILYLSARSISQASATRDYLKSLRQANLKLPEGPLFLNPEWALRAFKKEVIDRQPEVFKISCLTNLRDLFTRPDPYFAGYGNRTNDVTAYEAVGIPRPRIFIINKTGELRGIVAETFQTSYQAQSSLADVYFPPTCMLDADMDLNYWTAPHLDIDELQL